MEHYLGVAREKGITDEEIGAVHAIVISRTYAPRSSFFQAPGMDGKGDLREWQNAVSLWVRTVGSTLRLW